MNFPAVDPPDALLNNQRRYHSKPVASRPRTGFAYRILVARCFDDFIVVVNRRPSPGTLSR